LADLPSWRGSYPSVPVRKFSLAFLPEKGYELVVYCRAKTELYFVITR